MIYWLMKLLITGWQSGIDTRSLEIAKELWVTTWWVAPKWYATETWKNHKLKEYWLTEWDWWYSRRTRENIRNSDFTIIIFAKEPTPKELASEEYRRSWTAYTIRICEETNKPYAILYADRDSFDFWKIITGLETYNFAWPRESKIRNKVQCKHLITLVIKHLCKN